MGQAVQPVLEAMGVMCLRIEQPDEVVPTVGAALTMVFQSGQAVAVLLTQNCSAPSNSEEARWQTKMIEGR